MAVLWKEEKRVEYQPGEEVGRKGGGLRTWGWGKKEGDSVDGSIGVNAELENTFPTVSSTLSFPL